MKFDYCEEYIKQNIFMAVLRKANAYSVVICIFITINKKVPRVKIDSNITYEVLLRRNLIYCIYPFTF